MAHYYIGRCHSGRRWFWVANKMMHAQPCEYGWEATKERALATARAAGARVGDRWALVPYNFDRSSYD